MNGWSGANLVYTRFRPSGLGSNGNASGISFFFATFTTNFVHPTRRFDRFLRPVRATEIGGGGYTYAGAMIQIASQSPNNMVLSATTPMIHIIGRVDNFVDVAGCSFTFESALLLRR